MQTKLCSEKVNLLDFNQVTKLCHKDLDIWVKKSLDLQVKEHLLLGMKGVALKHYEHYFASK